MVLLFLSTLIFLWIINDLSFNSRDINRILPFQMSPSPLSAPPLFTLSGTLTVSFSLIKTNNKLIHLIRVIQTHQPSIAPGTVDGSKPILSLPAVVSSPLSWNKDVL